MKVLSSLYSRNREVLNLTVSQIDKLYIKRFRTQSALYCMIEDIKFPYVTHWRNGKNVPAYSPINYSPIVDHLVEKGILVKHVNSRTVEYEVNIPLVKAFKNI